MNTHQSWGDHDDTPYWYRAMIELQSGSSDYRSAGALIREFRPGAPRLIAAITDEIQDAIPSYAGPIEGKRRALISEAVSAAVHHFLDLAEDAASQSRDVDAMFHKLGYGEAIDGHDLAPLRAAFGIATRSAWSKLRAFGADNQLPDSAIGPFGDAIFNFINHLDKRATRGFDDAVSAMNDDVDLARMRILDSLVNPARFQHTTAQINTSGWRFPQQMVLMLVQYQDRFPRASTLKHHVLARGATQPAILICDADERDGVVAELQQFDNVGLLATSWPVPADDLPDAFRWTRRALELHGNGIITDQPVIDCFAFRTQLWLHAEPRLRRDMVQEILSPLLKETPNSREILSETLLAWLELRDTAAAMAAVLGVHPQTVRYRWKRINELFGESLRDPEFTTELIMVLKASVPLWRAGDHDDFERSQSGGVS